MDPLLPITFADKINSPEILAIMQKLQANTYFKAEEINWLKNAINELHDRSLANPTFKGDINLSTPAPEVTGIYVPTQSGTYTNFGGIVVDLTAGYTTITFDGSYAKQVVPMDLVLYAQKTYEGIYQPLDISTGYLCALLDSASRLLSGHKKDGSFYASKYAIDSIKGDALKNLSVPVEKLDTSVTDAMWKILDPSTGFIAAILDSNNRILLGIRINGSITGKFSDLSTPVVNCWGDSLTAGAGATGGVNYPYILQQNLTSAQFLVKNCGVGGEDVNSICARHGAIPVMLANGFTLPSDASTLVEVWRSDNLNAVNKYGKTITPLLQGTGDNTVNPVMIDNIECTLSFTGTGPYIYSLKRNVASSTHSNIASGSIMLSAGSSRMNDKVNIYWIGQNGGYTNEDQLISYYQDLIGFNQNQNYIIIGLHTGTAANRALLESKMASAFGAHYINWRRYIVAYGLEDAGITPTSGDTAAIAVGSCPPSLLSDTVHLNTAGYTVLGNLVYKRGKQLKIWN
ncbi:hypothetical protein [Flavobacterium denitrificans]|uniref:hypothetical protein n=1 Tax=Flavobacterium denitrificans TaxID=281361 RepID=UPI0004295AD2|nr:hypothetical protein [Flavobacterium denitrificans]